MGVGIIGWRWRKGAFVRAVQMAQLPTVCEVGGVALKKNCKR